MQEMMALQVMVREAKERHRAMEMLVEEGSPKKNHPIRTARTNARMPIPSTVWLNQGRSSTRDSDPTRHRQSLNAKTVAEPNAPRNPETIWKPKNRSKAANQNQELCPKALKAEEIRY
jgi:hypothetical protein